MSSRISLVLFSLGIPVAAGNLVISIGGLVLQRVVNGYGFLFMAGFNAASRFQGMMEIAGSSLGVGVATFAGQNFGAGKHKRVRGVVYWTWIMAGVVYLLFTTVYLCFGREIFALFTDDAAVIDLAPVFIRAIVWSFPGMVVMRGANSFLQGTANTPLLMSFAFIDAGARVLFSWLFGIVFRAGFPGFVLGFGIAIYGICIPGACYFLFAKWEKRKSMAHADHDA